MMEAWLGSPIKKHERSLSPLLKKRSDPEKIVLGVLGTRSSISTEDLEVNILGPIIEAWGIPDEMILPSEGESSYAFQTWAGSRGIPVHLVCCDWIQQGRKAGILREARIQRDATHLVLLQGPRSNALMVTATRLARKGRNVVISERPGLAVAVPANEKTKH
jgi:hypothetical protein